MAMSVLALTHEPNKSLPTEKSKSMVKTNYFPLLFSKLPPRGFQMVRMARLGLVTAPIMTLMVLINIRFSQNVPLVVPTTSIL